ncbi:MAG: hypothetical protein K8R74_18490, partial [Bacteroidales bacterium]|nr:hypothetical protein [Bacteroidales bacterium]
TLTSAEIRWFIKGKIPTSVFDWFIGLNSNYVNQPERTDHYLLLKSNDSLGIKLREGRIEIKQLKQYIGQISPGKNIVGNAETWNKWSFELDQAKKILSKDLLKNEWLAITKNRILVNYGITEENIVSQKKPISYQNGCITELTSINLNNEDWWSFGLEAYGEENRQKDNLVLISHLILNDKGNIRLSLNESLSYPGFIKLIGNQ